MTTPERSGLQDWLAANTLAAVSIAGALVYGVTRISYVGFYGEFGLDPEDVGIGYAATLARALPGLLVWTAGYLLLSLTYLAVEFIAAWLSRGRRVESAWSLITRRRFAETAAVLAIALFVLVAPAIAQTAATRVKHGDELRAPSGLISWGILRDPLGFTVREVNVKWVDSDPSSHTELGRTLMLLGTDSDVYYLFDVQFRRTLRLPRSLVIVREDIG